MIFKSASLCFPCGSLHKVGGDFCLTAASQSGDELPSCETLMLLQDVKLTKAEVYV